MGRAGASRISSNIELSSWQVSASDWFSGMSTLFWTATSSVTPDAQHSPPVNVLLPILFGPAASSWGSWAPVVVFEQGLLEELRNERPLAGSHGGFCREEKATTTSALWTYKMV
jgi:hypothetical protein